MIHMGQQHKYLMTHLQMHLEAETIGALTT
jgi:hypothetical protein